MIQTGLLTVAAIAGVGVASVLITAATKSDNSRIQRSASIKASPSG